MSIFQVCFKWWEPFSQSEILTFKFFVDFFKFREILILIVNFQLLLVEFRSQLWNLSKLVGPICARDWVQLIAWTTLYLSYELKYYKNYTFLAVGHQSLDVSLHGLIKRCPQLFSRSMDLLEIFLLVDLHLFIFVLFIMMSSRGWVLLYIYHNVINYINLEVVDTLKQKIQKRFIERLLLL